MTTNLVIGYPAIFTDATDWVGADASNISELAPFDNIIPSFNRFQCVEKSSSATTLTVVADLGASAARTIDFVLFVNGAQYLPRTWNNGANSSTLSQFALFGSTDNVSYATICSSSNVTTYGVYTGNGSTDLIVSSAHSGADTNNLSYSTSKRYYKLVMTYPDSHLIRLHPVILGTYFDLGKDPDSVSFSKASYSENNFIATSGASYLARTKKPLYSFEITWNGITDAKIQAFQAVVDLNLKYKSLFLITRSDHTILDSVKAINCQMVAYSHSPLRKELNYNTLSATFQELPS